MFFWFIGTAVVAVWWVFRDPWFDYRLLVVGAVLPCAVELPLGGAGVLHSATFSIALLAVLMIATSGRRPIRKMLLGLPVGTLLHLVFDGAWTNARVFWWPFLGLDVDGAPHPILERGAWNLPLELVGLALCWWVYRTAGLGSRDRRAAFARTGRLELPVR